MSEPSAEAPSSKEPAMTSDAQKQVIFKQSQRPPLGDGIYTLAARLTIPGLEPGSFPPKDQGPATTTFVVQGERFTIRPTEIDSVFPPHLANGEFDGVLPHVVLDRNTLPWERTIDTPGSSSVHPDAPWLAVLVLDGSSAPRVQAVTAQDLVPLGTPITVLDTPTDHGTGTLGATTLSYGAALLGQLEYGETPNDPCNVIDLPLDVFVEVAPAAADLQYLAHIREVDTTDGLDSDRTTEQHAVIVANRIPPSNGVAQAYLVSLEGMADYLPATDGTRSAKIDATITAVRLIVFQSWTFTTNDLDQTLEQLLLGLNAGGVSTLTLPIAGAAPSVVRVAQAAANQAAGQLASGDAAVLMQNALLMGYVPFDHHLRHGGSTVSFYRSPLVPLAVPPGGVKFYSGPDAANAYDPQTGLFDVSYGAAWQLGQLLALQSAGMANQLYQWKRSLTQQQALAAEQDLLTARLQGARLFPSLLARREAAANAGPPPVPPDVATWFGNLSTLNGVPFNYLVPDERQLPPESIRFFYLDDNWLDALLDGAFSVGRATTALEPLHGPALRRLARVSRGRRAANRHVAALAADPTGPVTGFLIRSAAISGWPNLRIVGYSDSAATVPLAALRVAQLANDTLLCLFDGVVASMYLREPPEQLHHGVEGTAGNYFTTLRSVGGGPGPIAAGAQYTVAGSTEPIPMRSDGRTLEIATAVGALQTRLTHDFQQTFPNGFTSAELALELTKGVVEVEYSR